MKKNTILNNKGFTIIELVAAMAITMMIMGATATALFSGNKNQTVADELADGRRNARLALKLLERDIRGAGSQVFDTVTPCGGTIFAATSFSELDDYREQAGSIKLTNEPYPITVTFEGTEVKEIETTGGGLGESGGNSHVFEVQNVVVGNPLLTIQLASGMGAPQPIPEWGSGTLLLSCGGDLDAMAGVIYEVTGGDYASGYTVTCPLFTGIGSDVEEANYVRSTPRAVMDVTYLKNKIAFNIDRSGKELQMRLNPVDPFETVLNGITDVRLLVDNGSTFTPISSADTSNTIRIEVDAAGPDDKTVTVASVVRLRNVN